VDVLPCGHVALRDERRACRHLLVEEPPECFLVLTGEGMRYDLACADCADDPRFVSGCEGCLDRAFDIWSTLGWRGEPEIRHRDRAVAGSWITLPCEDVPLNDRCLVAVPDGWLALTAEGLVEVTTRRVHGPVALPPEDPSVWEENRKPALHTSLDGRFAAVVTDYGSYGAIVDLSTDSVTLWLDRRDYHARTTPFPVAFTRVGDGVAVIAATDWNRLDVFDAATGRLLTDRVTDDHPLDYFHGGLALSPSGRWLLVDGWVWAPLGIRKIIDVESWLAGEEYAAERVGDAGWHSDEWDNPAAWLDDTTVVAQRLGVPDRNMIDGVQIVDVPSGRVVDMFAGPAGPMWTYNRLLYVVAAGGLEIWSPAEQARIGVVEGFHPTAQNPRTGELASLRDGWLRTWRP
jgi:hypothetical protein